MATPPTPPPQFCHGIGGKYSPVPCTRDSAHKTFGPTDLTSTYSMCTRRVFGGIGHRTHAFRSGVRCSNHLDTHGPFKGVKCKGRNYSFHHVNFF
ncbi:hypothetical protein TNCV_4221741 [Trichonephila clavipes]|nr:hypothetical protein TNCV_4221741 [Trichonephila clavipes]